MLDEVDEDIVLQELCRFMNSPLILEDYIFV